MVADSITPSERKYYPPATVAKARALYVVKGASLSEISAKLAVPMGTLSNWAAKAYWTADRDKRQQAIETTILARTEDSNVAFMTSVKTQAEELTEDSFQVARDAVASGQAKELQMASGAIRNFVDVYRTAAGMNDKNQGQTINIGQFFVNAPPPEVNPVVDIPAQQALPAPKE